MKRSTARAIHSATNMAYWVENPDWHTGNPVADGALDAARKLPLNMHESLKRAFYNTAGLIAVNGESVVVDRGETVDKFMFRYPDKMSLGEQKKRVTHEVGVVSQYLAGVALPTAVAVKPAYIFRKPETHVDAVTQTQPKLDLALHGALDLSALREESHSPRLDRTARDLEVFVAGTQKLVVDYGFYPDTTEKTDNIRRSHVDGTVSLIDVMPFYANGSRLIGDKPPQVIDHVEAALSSYADFVGQYGA
jgi:hypothetical protein